MGLLAIIALLGSLFNKRSKHSQYVCVNCWGIQEYDGVSIGPNYDRDIDFNNHSKRPAFIERFMRRYFLHN